MSNLLIQNQGICIIIVFANIDNSWIGSSTIHKCPPMLPNIRKTLNRKLNLVKQKIKLKNNPWNLSFKFKQNCKLEYFLSLVMLRERFVITNTITRIPSSWNISIMSFTNHIWLAWLGKNKLEFKFILM